MRTPDASDPQMLHQGIRNLLVVTEEDLDWQPAVAADLEALLEVVQLVDLVGGQLPAVELKVLLDAVLVDGLGDDAPALLQTPHQQHLLHGLALVLSDLLNSRVLVQRRVGGAQARVASRVDAL